MKLISADDVDAIPDNQLPVYALEAADWLAGMQYETVYPDHAIIALLRRFGGATR